MPDVESAVTSFVRWFEERDADAVREHADDRLKRWPVEGYLESTWHPILEDLAGAGRTVSDVDTFGDPPAARVRVVGGSGAATVVVGLDDRLRLSGLVIEPPAHGIRNIVIGTPRGVWRNDRVEGEPRELALFYGALLDMRIVRNDWIKIARDHRTRPEIAFGDGWSDERPPRWPDPDYPQQLHLDISVGDLGAAEQQVLSLGARVLQRQDAYRSYADPFGHPFCLYEEGDRTEIARVVFDCPDPEASATFYEGLLGMTRTHTSDEDVVIAHTDIAGPALAFQRSESLPPRWPDPNYPEQIHLDLYFDDGRAAAQRAQRLGGRDARVEGGPSTVYVDPAGHPFCITSPHRA